MTRVWRVISLPFQVACTVALLAGSIVAIWRAGEDAVARDRRRADALRVLASADDALALRGAPGLEFVPDWPDTLEPAEWATLDDWLVREATEVLSGYPEIGGGFFVPSADRYLGHSGATKGSISSPRRPSRFSAAGLPPRERDLIDDLVADALESDRPMDRIVEMPPEAVALRANPLRVNGRRVAAVWLVARLDDGGALGRSVRSYQWATALALGGLTLALIMSASLARTIRVHSVERRRLGREMRRNERLAALGTMLAGVSHQMRNPLAGIRSSAQLWQRGIMTDAELSSELVGEVDRLDAIVGHLLMFSRAEPKSLVPGDLNDVAAEAARLAAGSASDRGVVVDQDLASNLPRVAMDAASLLQVLRNLTSNAIESMPLGGALRIATRDATSGSIEVIVSDSGSGISREALDHLFEPFYTTKPDGTGLGLAIAREIVLAHGGELHARNRKSGGAEFVVVLPVLGETSP
jgi:two-component system, NtrC family, sensor histidine kinase HydH